MSIAMRPSDPAYFLLEQGIADPSKRSTPTVYRRGCYICDDTEYALMSLAAHDLAVLVINAWRGSSTAVAPFFVALWVTIAVAMVVS